MDLQTTITDELTPVVNRLADQVADRALTVVPAGLDTGHAPSVELDQGEMPLEHFLDLAVGMKQRLLYQQTTMFEPEQIIELGQGYIGALDLDAADHATLGRLREAADRCAGWPVELQVAFVHQGVVHRWTAEAAWREMLEVEANALFAPEDDLVAELTPAQEHTALARLSDELLALPSFRAATNERARQRIAEEHFRSRSYADDPFDELPVWLGRTAISQASDRVQGEQERRYADAEDRLPELARLVTADPDYCRAKRMEVRKRRIRNCLAAHTDGYPPPPILIELLIDYLDTARPSAVATLPLIGDEALFGQP
jgi:hypothetical protein